MHGRESYKSREEVQGTDASQGHYKDCKCKNKCPDMKKSIVLCDSDNCKGEEDKKKPECKTVCHSIPKEERGC